MPHVRVVQNLSPLSSSRSSGSATRLLALLIVLSLVLGACGRTPSASTRTTGDPVPASATPTSVDLPFPAPTSAVGPSRTPEPGAESEVAESAEPTEVTTPSATPTERADVQEPTEDPTEEVEEPTDVPMATATSTATPTSTSEPRATATPGTEPTARPTATSEPDPTSTPEPEETPTPSGSVTPTPFPTIDGVPLTRVGCDISPGTEVKVGEIVTFSATQEPAGLPISFVFNHGNGTIDPRGTSVGRYEAPGTYPVSLQWNVFESSGTVSCGAITVTGVGAAAFQPGDYVGLSEDGARSLASERGLASVRITRRDGESFAGTTDFRTDRLNLELDGGTVTTASIG